MLFDDVSAKLDKKDKEIAMLKEKNTELENSVDLIKKLLNDDQLKKLLEPKSQKPWSDLTLQQSVEIYYQCGTSAYDFLRERGFPLPSARTLQRHMQKINCEPGILHDMLRLMKLKVDKMSAKDKKVALVIDEMQIQAKKEYDPVTGQIMGFPTVPPGPALIERRQKSGKSEVEYMAQKMLSGMVAGLFWRFKNLVFFQFTDCSFDQVIMVQKLIKLIKALQDVGLDVKTLVGNMGMLMII